MSLLFWKQQLWCRETVSSSVCASQLRNVDLHVPESNSPVKMAAVWIQAWSVTRQNNAATAQMSRSARTVSSANYGFPFTQRSYVMTPISFFLKTHANLNSVPCAFLVNNKFNTLLKIPVNEQKGDSSFLLLICVPVHFKDMIIVTTVKHTHPDYNLLPTCAFIDICSALHRDSWHRKLQGQSHQVVLQPHRTGMLPLQLRWLPRKREQIW